MATEVRSLECRMREGRVCGLTRRLAAACLVVACAVGVGLAAEIPAGQTVDGVYHPDWEALVTANEADLQKTVIPAGQTWIAYERDMEWIRKIGFSDNRTQNFQFQIRGTLIMEDTTTWFHGYSVDGVGATYIKRGNTTATAPSNTGEQNAGGTLIIEEGTVVWPHPNGLGTWSAAAGGERMCNVEVRSGATFVLTNSINVGARTITIAGTGVNGDGALKCACSIPSATIVLSGDALVLDAGCGNNFGPSIDLAGHKLTIGATGSSVKLNNMSFQNPGSIAFTPAAGETRTVELSGTTEFQTGLSVTMPEDSRLLFSQATATAGADFVVSNNFAICSSSAADLVFGGVISGDSDVSFGDATYAARGSVTLQRVNGWTGATTVNGDSSFKLKLRYGGSVPDFSSLTVVGGTVMPVLGYDGAVSRWTADSLLSFSDNLQVSAGNRTITYDTTELAGAPALTIGSAKVAEYFPALDVVWNAVGTGTGGYTLTGPYTTEKPLDISLTGGAIRLSGGDQINLDSVLVSGTSATQGGTLVLDGAGDVVFGETPVIVGAQSASTVIGCMVVTNSVLRSTCVDEIITGYADAKGHLWVGSNAKGLLVVDDGGVVSNKVYTGGGGPGNVNGNGIGAVYQRGGVFAPLVNSQSYVSTTLGFRGFGFMQVEGGVVRPWREPGGTVGEGWFAIGGYGAAIFVQNGGTVDASGIGAITAGANNGGSGTYCIRKGTTTANQLNSAMGGNGGQGVITVDGPEARFLSSRNKDTSFNYTEGKSTIVNLNRGGLLEVQRIRQTYDNSKYTGALPTVLNFNGGTLGVAGSDSIFGSSATRYVAKVAVYEGGAAIDVANAKTVNTMYSPIVGAGGGGIQSIALGEPVEGMLAPNVTIVGPAGSYGATAIPEFDIVTRTVTNILVTSHGWGYTAEGTTIKLRDGLTDTRTLAFTVGDNVTGGFAKTGLGTLQLYNANEWEQWTKVTGGTLKTMEAGAIPSGTALTISNGATLDLNNVASPTFTGLGGTGGTVVNGSIAMTGAMSVSARQFVDRETTAITGLLNLSSVTEICLTDAEELTEAAKSLRGMYLFTATGMVLPAGEIQVTGVPEGWRAQLSERGLRLSPESGFLMLFR